MSDTPILQVQALRKLFPVKQTGIGRSPQRFVHAVDDVSFDLGHGEVLALVGESGCGKSTLALTLMGLETPTAGSIVFEGRDVTNLTGKDQKQLRRRIQMVFQTPRVANPLMTVGEIIAEPLQVHRLGTDKQERAARLRRALEDAGLKPAEIYLNRYPHELSGGQRQRVVIARRWCWSRSYYWLTSPCPCSTSVSGPRS